MVVAVPPPIRRKDHSLLVAAARTGTRARAWAHRAGPHARPHRTRSRARAARTAWNRRPADGDASHHRAAVGGHDRQIRIRPGRDEPGDAALTGGQDLAPMVPGGGTVWLGAAVGPHDYRARHHRQVL